MAMESEGAKAVSWRQEVAEKLHRLYSLLFATDHAAELGDNVTAQILATRLIGFLDSQSKSSTEESLIHRTRCEVLGKINSARQSIAPEYDRQAFEQARRKQGRIFTKKGDVDMEVIMKSKYIQPYFRQSKESISVTQVLNTPSSGGLGHSSIPKEKTSSYSDHLHKKSTEGIGKAPKALAQSQLTSHYGNKILKPNNMSHRKSIDHRSPTQYGYLEKTNSTDLECSKDSSSSHLEVGAEEMLGEKKSRTIHQNMEMARHIHDDSRSPANIDNSDPQSSVNSFVTARMKLAMGCKQKNSSTYSPGVSASPRSTHNLDVSKNDMRESGPRACQIPRRGVRSNFVPPVRSNGNGSGSSGLRVPSKSEDAVEDSTRRCFEALCGPDGLLPDKLRNLEPRLIEHVSNEIMDRGPNVSWNDIAGLEHAKKCVTEMVIWPLLRPDIFQGCRSPGRGLLLFGPPGTGKTMIGKAIAGEAKATFFYISASSLTSKWGSGREPDGLQDEIGETDC